MSGRTQPKISELGKCREAFVTLICSTKDKGQVEARANSEHRSRDELEFHGLIKVLHLIYWFVAAVQKMM